MAGKDYTNQTSSALVDTIGALPFIKTVIKRKCPRKESTEMIRAIYRKIPVEVLAEYEAGDEKYVAIQAIDGKPFLRKDKWMTKTEYATVKIDELTNLSPDPRTESEKPNLLKMALAYKVKQQWYAGESVWLWRNGNKGVFLKEMDGFFVTLNLTGYREYLIIFHLNPKTWKWEISHNLGSNYYQWIEQYKEGDP